MYRDTIWRTSRLLLAAGLCFGTLIFIGTGEEMEAPTLATEPEVSAVQPIQPDQPDLTSETAELQMRAAELLSQAELSEQQRQALIVRMEEDASLLQFLEQKKLTWTNLIYLALPNGRFDRLDRYNAWAAEHPEDTAETVVLQVNMDRDQNFYSLICEVVDPSSLTVLVNKHYILPAGYVPELEVLDSSYGGGSLRPEAAAAFRAMADAAQADGISLRSVSAYRSYATQSSIYNNYLVQYWQSTVDTFSARPGHTEHQTGLTLDINVASATAHFENTPAFAWLQAHCAEYGFILRYNLGQEDITGYRFEPWHYRYVGEEIAATIMEQEITYEEYTALQPVWGV